MTLRQRFERDMVKIRTKWEEDMRALDHEVEAIRGKYLPTLVDSGWTDTYFDGSFGPMWFYEIWDRPADEREHRLYDKFNEDSQKIARREMKKVWGTKHTCGRRKCYWHD